MGLMIQFKLFRTPHLIQHALIRLSLISLNVHQSRIMNQLMNIKRSLLPLMLVKEKRTLFTMHIATIQKSRIKLSCVI